MKRIFLSREIAGSNWIDVQKITSFVKLEGALPNTKTNTQREK